MCGLVEDLGELSDTERKTIADAIEKALKRKIKVVTSKELRDAELAEKNAKREMTHQQFRDEVAQLYKGTKKAKA